MKISICVPVYNGEKTIAPLVKEVIANLSSDYEVEIILVDDFSKDNSAAVCRRLASDFAEVKFIGLRKNFGEHSAVMCALNYVTGDYAAIIDDDFQNPPSEIHLLIEKSREGYDVVYARYDDKQHARYRNLGSKFNDLVAGWLLDKPDSLYLSSFKAISAPLVHRITSYTGPFPYIDGLILRETRNITAVTVRHERRREGQSNYTFKKLVSLWLDMFINFSLKPLRLLTLFGVVVTFFSFCTAAVFITEKMLSPSIQMGWTSVMVSILFFSGIQITFLGLIGEYVGKNYLQTNGTPQWAIREEHL